MSAKIAAGPASATPAWLGAAAPGRDLMRFGLAIAIAAAFSIVQVFVIPRRVDVSTYGHYRLFLVYTGYIGLLHFGLVDGLFVRWAGRSAGAVRREWRTAVGWLLFMEGAILAAAISAAFLTPDPVTRTFIVALGATTMCANVSALESFALQAVGDFKGAGRVAVATPGLFVAFVSLVPVHGLVALLSLYVGATAMGTLYGAIRILRHVPSGAEVEDDDSPTVYGAIATGLPVMGANLAAGMAQSVDRLLVSASTPIAGFALYGFASTVAAAANAATQALSRVALSHAARRPSEERATFLGGFLDFIGVGCGVAMLAEPLFEHLVAAYLPAYAAALPIVRAITIGVPFWIATHVVLVGTLQSNGLVRRQFALEVCGVVFVAALCSVAIARHALLWQVAGAATGGAVLAFIVGTQLVRRAVPSARHLNTVRFSAASALQAAALLVAMVTSDAWMHQTLAYLVLSLAPTAYLAARARQQPW